jgi:acetyl-CoA carboxylase/biotin carboxylase 1
MMEMYADEDSRAGVLEPEGIVGIKFRREKQLDTMARLDPVYGELRRRATKKDITPIEQSEIKANMEQREQLLLPIYTQVSLQFADLHDRAGRMKAKGTIRAPLQWQQARRFFYWRLRRRLTEERFLRKMANADKASLRIDNLARLKSLVVSDENSDLFECDDRLVANWYEDNSRDVLNKIEMLRKDGIAAQVAGLIAGHGRAALEGVARAVRGMGKEEREAVLKVLNAEQ